VELHRNISTIEDLKADFQKVANGKPNSMEGEVCEFLSSADPAAIDIDLKSQRQVDHAPPTSAEAEEAKQIYLKHSRDSVKKEEETTPLLLPSTSNSDFNGANVAPLPENSIKAKIAEATSTIGHGLASFAKGMVSIFTFGRCMGHFSIFNSHASDHDEERDYHHHHNNP
jgi:hypothetical protein